MGVGEGDDRDGRKIERETGTRNFILSCFTPQNVVKYDIGLQHDRCCATIHCRASLRLPKVNQKSEYRKIS